MKYFECEKASLFLLNIVLDTANEVREFFLRDGLEYLFSNLLNILNK